MESEIVDIDGLRNETRILIEVPLRPVQGTRFQPTGFPDLGAASYQLSDGSQMLLVESAQSMANRMETVCWDDVNGNWTKPLQGLPYIAVTDKSGKIITNSILEAHRINSPYILEGTDKTFFKKLQAELEAMDKGRVDMRKLASVLMKYDVNSLLHGVFLSKSELAGGRLRLPRALSGFIEASGVTIAPSGGVKKDDVNPKGSADKGFGHVPFHRDEYTGSISAYFNVDIAQIRGYNLGKDAENLLLALSLYKIQKFLKDGLRLRTACDLEVAGQVKVRSPEGFKFPKLEELESALPAMITKARSGFADPPVTQVQYKE